MESTAADIGHDTSASTLDALYTRGRPGFAPDPVAGLRWRAIALESNNGQSLLVPARIIVGPQHPLAPFRASLQRALDAAQRASTGAKAPIG